MIAPVLLCTNEQRWDVSILWLQACTWVKTIFVAFILAGGVIVLVSGIQRPFLHSQHNTCFLPAWRFFSWTHKMSYSRMSSMCQRLYSGWHQMVNVWVEAMAEIKDRQHSLSKSNSQQILKETSQRWFRQKEAEANSYYYFQAWTQHPVQSPHL